MACVRTITRMDGPVKDLSLSRDGALLAYASEPMPVDPGAGVSSAQQYRGVVEIVSTKTGELLQAFNLKWVFYHEGGGAAPVLLLLGGCTLGARRCLLHQLGVATRGLHLGASPVALVMELPRVGAG